VFDKNPIIGFLTAQRKRIIQLISNTSYTHAIAFYDLKQAKSRKTPSCD
jgi:hypothetical protein